MTFNNNILSDSDPSELHCTKRNQQFSHQYSNKSKKTEDYLECDLEGRNEMSSFGKTPT